MAKSSITALKGAWGKTSLPNLSETINKNHSLPNLSEFSDAIDKTLCNFGGSAGNTPRGGNVVSATSYTSSPPTNASTNVYDLSYRPQLPDDDDDNVSDAENPFRSLIEVEEDTETITFAPEVKQQRQQRQQLQQLQQLRRQERQLGGDDASAAPAADTEASRLAVRLESSLAELISYFKTEVLMGNDDDNGVHDCIGNGGSSDGTDFSPPVNSNQIPESVWNALADIDSVIIVLKTR